MSTATYPVKGMSTPGCELWYGHFVCNSASAPATVGGFFDAGATVGAPTSGRYTVTLPRSFKELVAGFCSLSSTGGSNDTALIDASTIAADDDSFVVETQSAAGTAANLSTGVVNLLLIVRTTTVSK